MPEFVIKDGVEAVELEEEHRWRRWDQEGESWRC